MSFDKELLRDGLFDMDPANVEEWEDLLASLVDLQNQIATEVTLAQETVTALKGQGTVAISPSEQVTNPFAAKNPQVVAPDKNAPREKHKGG